MEKNQSQQNKKKSSPSHSSWGFEHKNEPLASHATYNNRLLRYMFFALFLLLGSLFIGMLGYKYIVKVDTWADAFLNASMILTGMGPVSPEKMVTNSAKIFSGTYAIYSGVAFLSGIAIFFTPILHRFLHVLHVDIEE